MHFKTVCRSCKTVIAQCRCPSASKTTQYVDTCTRCEAKKVGSQKKSEDSTRPSVAMTEEHESGVDALKALATDEAEVARMPVADRFDSEDYSLSWAVGRLARESAERAADLVDCPVCAGMVPDVACHCEGCDGDYKVTKKHAEALRARNVAVDALVTADAEIAILRARVAEVEAWPPKRVTSCPVCNGTREGQGRGVRYPCYCVVADLAHAERLIPHLQSQLTRIAALEAVVAAFRDEITEAGIMHDDPDCPEDDTCRCENVKRINDAFAALDAAGKGGG